MLPSYREVRINEYREAIGADGQLIDVRQPDELETTGVIPGARNIPLDELSQRLDEIDPDRTVALVCRSGGRSGSAGQFLAINGYTSVVNLTGGMLEYAGPVDEFTPYH